MIKKKGQFTGRQLKVLRHHDRKLKVVYLESRKCAVTEMKNEWEKTGVNVCTRA